MNAEPSLDKTWLSFLRELDSELSRAVDVYCIGGFVLYAQYQIPRVTGDIDYLKTAPADAANEIEALAGADSKLGKKYRIHVHAAGVTDLPEDFESRLQPLNFGLGKIRLYAVDPYDLVLSKLTRNSSKDRADVKWVARQLQLSYKVLMQRWEKEMAPWIANHDRHRRSLQLWKEYFQE